MISFEALKQTGCWWADPWWEDSQNRRHSRLSSEEIQQRIETLKGYFDAPWVRAALARDPSHPIVRYFWGATGAHPFDYLMWIGAMMTQVARAGGLSGKVAELVEPDALSRLFEIQAASVFAAGGWPVNFVKRSREKTPDLNAEILGIEVAIECKRLDREAWEQWVTQLTARTGMRMGQPHLAGWDVEVLFNPRLSELLVDDEAINRAMLSEIDNRVSHLLATVDAARCPDTFHVADLVSVTVRKRVAGQPTPGIGGIEISTVSKLRRIINNGVRRALPQLKELPVSAIAVYSDTVPGQALLDVAMAGVTAAEPECTAGLAAVAILTPLNQAGGADRVWTNSNHQQQAVVAEIEKRFIQGFNRPGV